MMFFVINSHSQLFQRVNEPKEQSESNNIDSSSEQMYSRLVLAAGNRQLNQVRVTSSYRFELCAIRFYCALACNVYRAR